jgi:hypothetical protein
LRAAAGHGTYEILAHDALTFANSKACRFAASLAHAEEVLARYDPAAHAELTEWVGHDVGVDAGITSAFDLWYLGRAAAARRRLEEAVARARVCGHGFSLVYALCYAAVFELSAEDLDRARAYAEEGIARAEAERVPAHRSFAALIRAASLPREHGRLGAMFAVLEAARDRDWGALKTGESGIRALFASAIAEEGLLDLAIAQVGEAFAAAERSGERHHLPVLHMLRASLAKTDEEAEVALERALDTARSLPLPIAELHTALELARFRARTARRREASELLAPVVALREGEPDFPLLARARSLLADLRA